MKRKFARASVTVFVTIILIPTIVLSGILTEIARINLYSNQALMTADNYGETVLTQYDDLLKELYGLFAVTQDEEALKGIETLQEYMKTSFSPNSKTISFQHLQGTFLNKGTSYEGFTPYGSANVELSYEAASDQANLGNNNVLATQIGDFMRYRIVQSIKGDVDWVLNAIDQVKGNKANTEVVDAQQDLTKQCDKALEAMRAYYLQLSKIATYEEYYLKELNHTFQTQKKQINELKESERYTKYINAAQNEKNAQNTPPEENTEGTESTEESTEDVLDLQKEGQYFSNQFDEILSPYKTLYNKGKAHDKYEVTFQNYESAAKDLVSKGKKVKKELDKIKALQSKLDQKMEAENVSEDLKKNIQEENAELHKLFDSSEPSMDGDNYVALANAMASSHNFTCNTEFSEAAKQISECLDDKRDYYMRYFDGRENYYADKKEIAWAGEIKISKFDNFDEHTGYETLYRTLGNSFQEGSNSEAEKEAKDAKKKGENASNEKQNALSEETFPEVKNIPDGIPIGDTGKADELKISSMIKSAASLFNGSLGDAKNELLLKIYTIHYDTGMFSDRVTNAGDNKEKQKSLTGYEMSEKINYLYQSELEYLYGGHKSSTENLKETRNSILLFRMSANMVSTYTIKEVNNAIRAVTKAASAVNPVLGVAAAAALRLGVAGIETYKDWELLKKGESVTLLKTKVEHLTSYEELKEMLPGLKKNDGKTTENAKSIKLDYDQYVFVMLFALVPREKIIQRTGDLICLNINNVEQNGNIESLKFQMDHAITAVKASCSIHMNYLYLSDRFVRTTVSDGTATQMQEFEKNKYKYSVIRGY